MNKQRYFDSGKVKREAIAMDIRYGRISHSDLIDIITDSDISAEFYGDKYEKKVPKEQWDEQYLEKLSYAVVSESFNKDYLLYLEEVANGVSEKKNSPKVIIGAVVLVVAVVALIVVIVSMT